MESVSSRAFQPEIDFTRRPQVPFWDTTSLPVHELAAAIKAAERQDEAVLAIFRAIGGSLSPSQVHAIGRANGLNWLPTSVRRSMTNLANPKCGALVHLHTTRMGPYGRPEGLWALPTRDAAA